MIRISALNDSSDDESQSVSKSRPTTKEAQESAALALYNRALDLLKRGNEDGAKNTFIQLLETAFIKNAEPSADNEILVDPGLVVKYSSYKNLGSMAAHREEYQTAMAYYLEAVMVDSSDVTVWYKVGTIALKIHNYPLARHAFEQGLVCQPRHWPCLDNVITVLYALYNYDACLVYIARALERDPGYIKGISFMEKILEEQPSLRRHMGHHFTSCDESIFTNEVDQDEADEYIEEALTMRKKKQELCQSKEKPMLKFTQPLCVFTWVKLGSCLISLYDHIASSEPPITYSCKVDLSGNLKPEETVEQVPAVEAAPSVPTNTEATPSTTAAPTPATTATPTPTTTESTETKPPEENPPPPAEPADKLPEPDKEREMPIEMGDGETSQADTSKLENTGDGSREKELAKRGPKRKRFMADSEKRRSARVRNTGSKVVEDQFKIQDLLVNLLPTSMTQVRVGEEGTESSQEEPMDLASQENSVQQGSQDSGMEDEPRLPELRDTEQTQVLEFLEKHQSNSGIIDLINEFLVVLAQKVNLLWPDGLALIYTKAYTRLHKHIQYPGYLCRDVSHERIRSMSKMSLMHAELKVDRWIGIKSRASPSRRSGGVNQGLGPNFPGSFFHSDLAYLEGVSQCQDIFDEEWASFIIRVFWMSAKFRMLEGKTTESITDYESTASYVEYAEKEKEETFTLTLPNIQHDGEVTLEKVKQQVESLRRCQSQDKMQGLHDSGEYTQVIKLLLETFDNPDANQVLENQERHAQLLLLVESLLKLKDYKRCIIWGEVSLNEALQNYNSASSNQARDEWASTATQLMDGIDKAITAEQTIIRSLTSKCLVRFTQNLLSVIEVAFDVPESAHEMGIPTMLPWILMYKLIYFEECQQTEGGEEESFQADHSGSLSLLETAHEQLGRRSWCCNCDGALLLFIVSEIVKQVKKVEEAEGGYTGWGEYDHILEQCFFCMYGHPNRRRAKHLQDHSSSQISLTWDRSSHVFGYFKPQTMPEYDSLKTSTVSGELEALLRRIYIMIPTDTKLSLSVDLITSYIEGTSNEPPEIPEGQETTIPIVGELYYLLADYYFKNKEQGKAIKFYLQDLCVNPDRFDSWAGMALARASRLEQKLSLSELKAENKAEGSIWKHAIASLRCFQRALQLDNTNSKLWIEYGSLAYQLHAHASRQIKQVMYPLSGPSMEEATNNRTEMLTIAGNCYRKAGECEADDHEEEWLHHYMLGKVAEKKGAPPAEYLEHYKQALHYLHEDRARYPKKITYIYSPPHLAVETLEVFYRLHVSIIKYLTKHTENIPYSLFESYIKEAAEGPFATCKEKEKKAKERESSVDEGSNSNMLSPISASQSSSMTGANAPSITSTPISRATKNHSARMDHTYSRQGSMDSSRSDAENSNEGAVEASLNRRMVTNQRTGVAILASDSMDSMQSPVAIVTSASPAKNEKSISAGAACELTFTKPESTVAENPKSVPKEPESVREEGKIASVEQTPSTEQPKQEAEKAEEAPEQPKEALVGVPDQVKEEHQTPTTTTTTTTTAVPSAVADTAPPVSKAATSKCEDSNTDKHISSDALPDTTTEGTKASEKITEPLPQNAEQSQPLPSTTRETLSSPVQDIAVEKSPKETKVAESLEADKPTGKVQVIEITPQKPAQSKEENSGKAEEVTNPKDTLSVPVAPKVQGIKSVESAFVDSLDDSKGLEELEKQIKTEGLFQDIPVMDLVSEGSSQDSTTVAELEKLKSEISFLNAGSSDLQSNVFSNTYDDMMIKVEKDENAEQHPVPEKSKESKEPSKETEEMDNSQTKALEALKSELQMLSAASGSFVIPDYIGQGEKTEPSVSASQGFDVSDLGLNDSQESMEIHHTEPQQSSEEVKKDEVSSKEPASDDLSNLVKLESSLQKMDTIEEDGNEGGKIDTDTECKKEREESTEAAEKPADNNAQVMNDTPMEVDENIQPPGPSSSESVVAETTDKGNSTGSPKEDPIKAGEQKSSSQTKVGVSDLQEKVKSDEPELNKEKEPNTEVQKEKSMVTSSVEEEKEEPAQPSNTSPPSSNVTDQVQPQHPDTAAGNNKDEGSLKEKGESKSNSGDMPEKSNESGVSKSEDKPEKSEESVSNKEQYKSIMSQCMKGLLLCLSRFPHHYKSLYRMAYIYYHSKEFKNDSFARDMLLGNINWPQLGHMASPGLFQDRKSTNFFQGLWRIPIEEIDRSGSFACHMLRSLQLLFPILKDLKDHKTLYNIHTMLSKNPDAGKKYLRDSDRVELSRLAMVYTIDILEELVPRVAETKDREEKIKYLLDLFKVWQYAVKTHQQSHVMNKLMRKAYFALMKDQIEEEPSVLEQAIRFCQREQELVIKSPTTPEIRSMPSTPTSLVSSHPLAGVSGASAFQGESPRQTHDLSIRSVKGITPIPGTSKGNTTLLSKPLSKVLKPCSVRLTSPSKSKPLKTGPISKSTSEGLVKKLTAGNFPKKPETKKSTLPTSTSVSPSTGQKSTKPSTAVSSASMYSGFTAAQLASLGNTQAASMYAKLAQMSPQAFLQAQYGAAQEAMMSQMALASSLGMPLASMAYMYPQMTMDPTLWSSYVAAQAFAEATATTSGSSSSSQSQRHTMTVANTTQSTVVTSSAAHQRQGTKVARPATVSTGSEPPRKVVKTDMGTTDKPMSLTIHDQPSSSKGQATKTYKPISLTKNDKPLQLTTKSVSSTVGISSGAHQSVPSVKLTSVVSGVQKPGVAIGQKPTTVSGMGQPKPTKLKLSTTASELYAVRMSSALARMSNTTSTSSQQSHTVRGPPPKIQRIAEPSPSSTDGENLSHLDLLASAAQAHRMLSQTSLQTTGAKVGHTPAVAASSTATYKGPSAKSLVKRSPHYRPNRGPPAARHHIKTTQQPKVVGVSQASKQATLKPPAAHVRPPIQKVPAADARPSTQPIQVTGTAAAAEVFKMVKNIDDLQANIQADLKPSGVAGVTTKGEVFSARKIPTEIQKKLAAQIKEVSMGKPPVAHTHQLFKPQQGAPASLTSSQMMKKPAQVVSSPGQHPHSSLLAQHLIGKPRPQPPAAHGGSRSVVPAGSGRPGATFPSRPGGVNVSNVRLVSGGFGRGKPSHPATLASRMQDDSSSDDCIVISSGKESDSE